MSLVCGSLSYDIHAGIYTSALPGRAPRESIIISGVSLLSAEARIEGKDRILEIDLEDAWQRTHIADD